MLTALRTSTVEPHVGDVDVARQHIDVDAGMVAAIAIEPYRPRAVLAHVRQVHRRTLIFRRHACLSLLSRVARNFIVKTNADHATLPPDDGDLYRLRAGDLQFEAIRN